MTSMLGQVWAMTSVYSYRVTFLHFIKFTLPRDLIHIKHGFKVSDCCFLYRETGLCTLDGLHHTLLSYSPGLDLSSWSDDIQTSMAEQTRTIHGLEYDDPRSKDQSLIADDVKRWYKTDCRLPIAPLWVC